jgi:hypothetical protein
MSLLTLAQRFFRFGEQTKAKTIPSGFQGSRCYDNHDNMIICVNIADFFLLNCNHGNYFVVDY